MYRKASVGYDTIGEPKVLGNVDTLRMAFSYIIALVVVIGGGLYIFWHGTTPEASSTLVVVAGFMGSALTFVFGLEVQTRTARQSESQSAAHTAATVAATVAATEKVNGNGEAHA
jgi:hypothetical protein